MFKTINPEEDVLRTESATKIKIGILSGSTLYPIKTVTGGGNRVCFLNKYDQFDTVLAKISQIYFPSKHFLLLKFSNTLSDFEQILIIENSNQSLGSLFEFDTNLLDFKKVRLNKFTFENFYHYIEINGLQLNIRPIFYLHIIKKSTNMFIPKTTLIRENSREFSYISKNVISSTSNNKPLSIAVSTASTTTTSTTTTTKKKRSRSPSLSSDTSVSSSDTTASWKNAKKLEKTINNRIEREKNLNNNNDDWKKESSKLKPVVKIIEKKIRSISVSSTDSDERPTKKSNEAIKAKTLAKQTLVLTPATTKEAVMFKATITQGSSSLAPTYTNEKCNYN